MAVAKKVNKAARKALSSEDELLSILAKAAANDEVALSLEVDGSVVRYIDVEVSIDGGGTRRSIYTPKELEV